jgi:hypothetical protein
MTSVTRRAFVGAAASGAAVTATLAGAAGQDHARKLRSLSTAAQPISAAEHRARLEEATSQCSRTLAALLVGRLLLEVLHGRALVALSAPPRH